MKLAWQDQGNCLGSDPDKFFPIQGQSNEPAKAICALCDVRVECLDYALVEHEPGIYGGTSERERRFIRRIGISGIEYLEGLSDGSITPPRRGRPSNA